MLSVRRGTSLVELLVALAMASVVLAAATASMLRQHRGFRWVGSFTGAEAQMRPLVQILPAELALLDAAAGDLVTGQASDSSLQIRAVVASSLACDTAAGSVTLVPTAGQPVPLGGSARQPAAGDSLWFFAGDSLGWQPRRIVSVSRVRTGCARPALPSGPTDRLGLGQPAGVPGGTPLRITRHERYVVYRASDGRWYLGLRDWSIALSRFAAPQPIAGPFVRSMPTGEATGFRFFDSSGAALTPDGTNEARIARLRIGSLALVPSITAGDSVRRDSTDVTMGRFGAP